MRLSVSSYSLCIPCPLSLTPPPLLPPLSLPRLRDALSVTYSDIALPADAERPLRRAHAFRELNRRGSDFEGSAPTFHTCLSRLRNVQY
eukprot:2512125-Rhodomonas_salina.1